MPHVIVKFYPGRSGEQKRQLANEIVKSVVEIAGCEEKSVSIAIEEVEPDDWAEKVYQPDIIGNEEKLIISRDIIPFKKKMKIRRPKVMPKLRSDPIRHRMNPQSLIYGIAATWWSRKMTLRKISK